MARLVECSNEHLVLCGQWSNLFANRRLHRIWWHIFYTDQVSSIFWRLLFCGLVDWSNERWAAWPTRGGSCPLWSAGDAGERSDRSGPTVPQSHTTQSHHGRTEGRTQCNDSQHFVNCNPRSQPPCRHQHTCRLKMKKDTKFCGSDNAGRLFLQIALILSFCSGTNCVGLEKFLGLANYNVGGPGRLIWGSYSTLFTQKD